MNNFHTKISNGEFFPNYSTPQTTFQLLCEFYCTNNIESLVGISHLNITKDAKLSISQKLFAIFHEQKL